MASWTIPILRLHRSPSSHRDNSSHRILAKTNSCNLLSVRIRLLPVRTILRLLLDHRHLLVRQIPILALEMGHGTKILRPRLGIRRPSLQHTTRTIRTRRNQQRPVRPDDARPTTTQPSALITSGRERQNSPNPFPLQEFPDCFLDLSRPPGAIRISRDTARDRGVVRLTRNRSRMVRH